MSEKKRKPGSYVKLKDLNYAQDIKSALVQQTPRFAWVGLWLILAVLVFGFLWAAFARIDVQTISEGKVIHSSRLQIIQNLEGGIIRRITVREGAMVKKGEIVAELDKTRFASDYYENLKKLAVLEARVIRLRAEAAGDDKVMFPEKLVKQYPHLVKSELILFESRHRALKNQLVSLQKSLALINKEIGIVKPLVQKGVMSRLELIRLQKEEVTTDRQLQEKKNKMRTESQLELNKVSAELAVLRESIKADQDRLQRTVIRSPVNGVVNKLYVTTVGQVVKPGEKMMDIVPRSKNLTIETKVKPADIGFIHPKQKAIVKVSAYDSAIYGSLDAIVENISADTITDNQGNTYYQVILKTNKNFLGDKEKPLSIIPGMTVTVHIITGEKSVLTYILKPFLRAKSKAFKER